MTELERIMQEYEQSISLEKEYQELILRFLDTPEKIREWSAWLASNPQYQDDPWKMARKMTEAAVHIGRGKETVITPWYWEMDRCREKVPTETVYGNKIRIPKVFSGGWETVHLVHDYLTKQGLNPTDDIEEDRRRPKYYDLRRVFYEIYKPEP